MFRLPEHEIVISVVAGAFQNRRFSVWHYLDGFMFVRVQNLGRAYHQQPRTDEQFRRHSFILVANTVVHKV